MLEGRPRPTPPSEHAVPQTASLGEEVMRVEDLRVHFPHPQRPGLWVNVIDLTLSPSWASRAAARRRPAGSSSSSLARPRGGSPSTDRTCRSCGHRRVARLPAPYVLPGPLRDAQSEAHDPVEDPCWSTGSGRGPSGARGSTPSMPRPAADFAAPATRTSCRRPASGSSIAGALVAFEPESSSRTSRCRCSTCLETLRLMLDLRAARGLTYLFITHDLSRGHRRPDRRASVPRRCGGMGPAERIIRSPQNPCARALVSPTQEGHATPGQGGRPRRSTAHIPTGCRFSPRRRMSERVRPLLRVEEPPLINIAE